uniref:Cornifelin n=1 Tax=Varanus komodoensis TaxID=61221 RepID=A0A8D2JAS3_VARKO
MGGILGPHWTGELLLQLFPEAKLLVHLHTTRRLVRPFPLIFFLVMSLLLCVCLPGCVGLCCPSILSCYISHKYEEHCFLGMVPGGMTALRTHMRLSYGIPGTVCSDALSMCLCGWCELCRMAREVHIRSRS